MRKLCTCVSLALLLVVLASCAGNDQATSGDPLADAFVDELARDAGFPWFQALDRDETQCFATTVLDTVGEQRRTELRIAPDNIPLLFHADWSDAELDALTEIFATCVDDTTTGNEAYVLSLFGGQDRYSDCLTSEPAPRPDASSSSNPAPRMNRTPAGRGYRASTSQALTSSSIWRHPMGRPIHPERCSSTSTATRKTSPTTTPTSKPPPSSTADPHRRSG